VSGYRGAITARGPSVRPSVRPFARARIRCIFNARMRERAAEPEFGAGLIPLPLAESECARK